MQAAHGFMPRRVFAVHNVLISELLPVLNASRCSPGTCEF